MQSAVWMSRYLEKRWCIPSGHVFSSAMWLLVNELGGKHREAGHRASTSQQGYNVCQKRH